MHSVAYLVAFFFHKKLSTVGSQKRNSVLWSFVYSLFLLVCFLVGTNTATFFTMSSRSFDYYQNAETIEPSLIVSLVTAGVLGVLFFYTVRLGGYAHGSRFGFLIFVPGLIINNIAAWFLFKLFL